MPAIFESFKKTSIEYFDLSERDFDVVTPNMISPFVLELPKQVLIDAQNIVRELHSLTQDSRYQKRVAQSLTALNVTPTTVSPLLCSLDVHVLPDNSLKIIEINTNASSYLISAMNYKTRGLDTFPNCIDDIIANFATTIAKEIAPTDHLAIMDENPSQQKQFIEFLMYKHLFKKALSVESDIVDPSQLVITPDKSLHHGSIRIHGIYNRHTDFYLNSLPHILEAHNTKNVLLSPNPWGYALLADKKRMTDLQNPDWCPEISISDYPTLKKALLKTIPFSQFSSSDELWKERSKYFFKPAESYGSKSVYSGKSVSRKKFEEIFSPEMLAQETAPPPEVTFDNKGTPETFKYDLRFFFFEDKIQLGFARTYRGQLTNLQTPLGGHAPLVFQ